MGKKMIWLAFDFGVKGDYEGLYAWLDEHQAKECSSNLAVLNYEVGSVADLVKQLKEDLSKKIEFGKHDRIYLIWRKGEKIKGKYLFGKRKSAPWIGFGSEETEDVDEEL